MSAYSGATSGGFNQSGGGYFLITSSIGAAAVLSFPGTSGSAGATTVPALTAYTGSENYSTTTGVFSANKLIKDMGKTVVSAGRAFRKFQAVVIASQSTGGVTGVASPAPGYLTAYLEVTAPAAGGSGVVYNPIVRYA